MVSVFLPFIYIWEVKMKLFEVTDAYINYMKQWFYKTMMDNKENFRRHSRKYLGIVLEINGYKYFAPLSSPKPSDYLEDGSIRKSSSIILRMVKDYNTFPQLLGTIKLNNMLPVPESEIHLYDLENEVDIKYKNLVIDELEWVQHNTSKILEGAKRIYNSKINDATSRNEKNAKFLDSIMPFKDAEEKCNLFK